MMDYLAGDYCIIETDDAPVNRSVTGYGSKIPTRYMLKGIFGNEALGSRLRRIYAISYSNVASFYILIKGQRFYIPDSKF